MNEILQLAQQTIDLLTPLLPLAGAAVGHIADGFLSEPGAKLFDWLTSKFRDKHAAATLEQAIEDPQNTWRLEALKLAIAEHADKDPEFRKQLSELVQEAQLNTSVKAHQHATAQGDGNKIAQVAGTNNKIDIR